MQAWFLLEGKVSEWDEIKANSSTEEFLKGCTNTLYWSLYVPRPFFSCNETQRDELEGFPCIVDQYPKQGPLGGILSAFEAYPHTSFLVLACDLPNITLENLQNLVAAREPSQYATLMQHPQTGQTEPLIGIWEAKCYGPLTSYWNKGRRKVMDFLSSVETVSLMAEDPSVLQNVNTYQEYLAIK